MFCGNRKRRRELGFELIICVLNVFMFSFVESLPHTDWNYNIQNAARGPQAWHISYPACAGNSQSPIRIYKRNVIYDPKLRPLNFSEYALTEGLHLHLVNYRGRTAKVKISGRDIFLHGGSLYGNFRLVQFHFHWGKDHQRGSEHILNGNIFPLEIHFVHSLQVPNSDPSAPSPKAVVAFVFQNGRHNEKYDKVLDYLALILHPGNETHIPTFPLSDLLPVARRFLYYRYNGSLTTPPCSEYVTWSVVIDRIPISMEQVAKFRFLFDAEGKPLVDNFRPTQNINGRRIYTNSKRYSNRVFGAPGTLPAG